MGLKTLAAVIAVCSGASLTAEIISLPPAPALTPAGHALILSFEGFDRRPAWPGGASGVTVGWGYDLGYYSRTVILSDWHELPCDPRIRFSEQSGLTRYAARDRVADLRDILIDRAIGERVFDNVDVAREHANCRRAFPGFDDLRPNAQAALMSLTFNRGTSMIGDNRREMRAIRDLVPSKNYAGLAEQLRSMTRIWRGTTIERGMRSRRYAEAALMETP
jgi:GH24 family phage-related lysozyme (muramidase)